MALALVVTGAFGEYRKGEKITDAAKVAEISESPDARHTVRFNLPDAPADVPATKGKASATASA